MKILKLEAFSNLIYISPTTDISVLAKAIFRAILEKITTMSNEYLLFLWKVNWSVFLRKANTVNTFFYFQ